MTLTQLNRWNWGAFLLPYFWIIGNRVWIGLFAWLPAIIIWVIPLVIYLAPIEVGHHHLIKPLLQKIYDYSDYPRTPLFFDLAVRVILGMKGSKYAWEKFSDEKEINEFIKYQKLWENAGFIVGTPMTICIYMSIFYLVTSVI